MNNEFNILLRLHRRQLSDSEKQRPIKKVIWLYPLATEKMYSKGISAIMKDYINSIMLKLEGKLGRWIRQNRDDMHSDAWESEYKEFLDDLEKMLALYFGIGLLFDKPVGTLVQEVADKSMSFAVKQWSRQTEAVLGDPYNSLPPTWMDLKSMWMDRNYQLIKELGQEYNKKLSTILVTGLLANWTYNEFADQFELLNKRMSGSRSALIGRDQVGILTGSIIHAYAKSIGNDLYVWNTAMDERVRGNPTGVNPKAIPSHWAMEGLICKWSDNSVYSTDGQNWKKRTAIMESLPPGFPINCRCLGSIYWDNFVRDIGG